MTGLRDVTASQWIAGGLIVAGLGLLWHSFAPRYAPDLAGMAPNAMILPRVLLVLIVLLGLGVTVARQTDTKNRQRIILAGWLGLALIAGAALLPHIGFLAMVTPVCLATLVLGGERRWLPLTLASLLTGPAMWYLFHHLLLIRLPSILPGGTL